jgi:succinyl-diaminopimelate desuccinylase
LIGRGANDDKGQLVAMLAATAAWQSPGNPPMTVLFVADGSEEIGSPGLAAALRMVAPSFRPDMVLVCDTERARTNSPTVTLSQRGHILLDIEIGTGGPAVHSGRLGGAVIDPVGLLISVLGRVASVVRRWPATGPDAAATRIPDVDIIRAARGRAVHGGALHRRITDGPALAITRLSGGAAQGSIAERASARLDIRLPPDADVGAAVAELKAHSAQPLPRGIELRCNVISSSSGHLSRPGSELLTAVDRACLASYGQPATLVRSGGSLPAVRLLQQAFGVVPVILGLGTPAGGAHGPDEFLDIPGWTRAVELLVQLFAATPLKSAKYDIL